MKKNKAFDCVEMKRRGAAVLLAKLVGMTPEQEMEFWRERTEALLERQRRIRAEHARDQAA